MICIRLSITIPTQFILNSSTTIFRTSFGRLIVLWDTFNTVIIMAWLAVDYYGYEYIFAHEPERDGGLWIDFELGDSSICIPKGSIKKLIGRDLTWQDKPVELKEE